MQDVFTAGFHGILDSLRGFVLIFTLDRQIELQRSRMRENKSKKAARHSQSAPGGGGARDKLEYKPYICVL